MLFGNKNSRRTVFPSCFFTMALVFVFLMLLCSTESATRRSLKKDTRVEADINEEPERRIRCGNTRFQGHERNEQAENEHKEARSGEMAETRHGDREDGTSMREDANQANEAKPERRSTKCNNKLTNDDERKLTESERKEQRSTESLVEKAAHEESQERRSENLRNGKALNLEFSSTITPPPSTSHSSENVEELNTVHALLEFDTAAPGFFPSSPGFSNDNEKGEEMTTENVKETIMDKSAEDVILLDSPNGTSPEAGRDGNNSKFWEFERVELLENATSSISILLNTENATLSSNIATNTFEAVNDNSSLAEDIEIVGTTAESFIESSSVDFGTSELPSQNASAAFDLRSLESRKEKNGTETTTVAEENTSNDAEIMKSSEMPKKSEPTLHEQFFSNANSSEIDCDDSQETVETTEAVRSAKNTTKSKVAKPAETEFFAGVDEPNDDKDNRAEQPEELLNSRKEQLEALQDKLKLLKQLPAGPPEISKTTPKILQLVDRLVTTTQTLQTGTPYTFDCSTEVDDRGELLCMEWAKGGLCEINKATRFLFCRRTCLCVGVPS